MKIPFEQLRALVALTTAQGVTHHRHSRDGADLLVYRLIPPSPTYEMFRIKADGAVVKV